MNPLVMLLCVGMLSVQANALPCAFMNLAQPKAKLVQLNARVEECVLDVRDRNISYRKSSNCGMLRALAEEFYKLDPGGKLMECPEVNLEHTKAREQAWMAVALHNAKYRQEEPITFNVW